MLSDMERPLSGRVALVAGATRGAGRSIAVELARSGALVHATGRSSRATGPSEIGRPETIEETGDMVAAVGEGVAHVVDHEDADAVAALVAAIDRDHGRLDVLVNDAFGGDRYAQWDKPLWEHDLDGGWRMLGMGVRTHLVTLHHALPLMLHDRAADDPGLVVEMTDGTAAANAEFRRGRRLLLRPGQGQRRPHRHRAGCRAGRPPGRRGRRDAGLAALGGDAGHLRGDRGDLARRLCTGTGVRDLASRRRTSPAGSRPSPQRGTPAVGPARS